MMNFLPDEFVELDKKLRHNGLCIVPVTSTPQMNGAAANAMRKRKDALGEECFVVGNKTKAALRWTAMLEAWWAAHE